VIADIRGRHPLWRQPYMSIERTHDPRIDATAPKVIEAALVKLVVPVARRTRLVGNARRAHVEVLEREREIVLSAVGNVFSDLPQQLREAAILVGDEEICCIVEANAVNAELVDPVEAYVADEFACASVVKVEIRKPGELTAEAADVRARIGILVHPEIGKASALLRAHVAHVIEDAVHDHVYPAIVAFTHQPFQPR
jgi:hypothetical protein